MLLLFWQGSWQQHQHWRCCCECNCCSATLFLQLCHSFFYILLNFYIYILLYLLFVICCLLYLHTHAHTYFWFAWGLLAGSQSVAAAFCLDPHAALLSASPLFLFDALDLRRFQELNRISTTWQPKRRFRFYLGFQFQNVAAASTHSCWQMRSTSY